MIDSLLEIPSKGIVLEGSNFSDLKKFRPGLKAIKEFDRVYSPFIDFKVSEEEISKKSKEFKLPSSNYESLSCLLTRIPYRKNINKKTLKKIDELETFLLGFGIKPVRVRFFSNAIEIETRKKFLGKLKGDKERITRFINSLNLPIEDIDFNKYKEGKFDEK